MITSLDNNFASYTFDKFKKALSWDLMEKEFNTGFVAGSILKDYPECASNYVQALLMCPRDVQRNLDSSRNFTRQVLMKEFVAHLQSNRQCLNTMISYASTSLGVFSGWKIR